MTLMMERTEAFAAAKPKIDEVMTLVPGFWTEVADMSHEWGSTYANVGGEMVFAQVSWEGRIEISLSWSKEMREAIYRLPSDQITAAPTRPAKAIANQVAKMLKNNAEGVAEATQRFNGYIERVSAQQKNTEVLTKHAGVTSRESGKARVDKGNVWGTASVSSTDVILELHNLTIEQAEAILELLK